MNNTNSPLKLSIIIPAYNEEMNILPTLEGLLAILKKQNFPYEILVVNDSCVDNTQQLVEEKQKEYPQIIILKRSLPRGFGRALREGLVHASGEVIVPVMADHSEDPQDVLRYYKKIAQEGYDCVFGSRFIKGGQASKYPRLKLVINRLVNRMLQMMFLTSHNDLTNAFKAYRREVIQSIMPLQACHFNITIEMSLSALIRGYKIAKMPISWNGRSWGQSNLKLRSMGRRYLSTLLKIWFERVLILDDVIAEKQEVHQDKS